MMVMALKNNGGKKKLLPQMNVTKMAESFVAML